MPAAKRSLDLYVVQTFPVQCRGRGVRGQELFSPPVDVVVNIYKSPGSNIISSKVECPYNRGSHGEYCGALSKITLGEKRRMINESVLYVPCAYAFDVPRGE